MMVGVMKRSHWNRSRNSNIVRSPKGNRNSAITLYQIPAEGVAPNAAADKIERPPCKVCGLRLPQSTATIRLPAHDAGHSPKMTLCFEDFPTGRFGSFGPRHVTREEMLAFAAEFDPQPMHLDEAAAQASMLQGLSGSG